MNQPIATIHKVNAPAIAPLVDAGKCYLSKFVAYEVDAGEAGAGTIVLAHLPVGTVVKSVVARVEEAFDGSGTCEVGVVGDIDAFIDSVDYDEAVLGAFAQSLGSVNASAPDGHSAATAVNLIATVGGTPTTGKLVVLVEYLDFEAIKAQGYQFSV